MSTPPAPALPVLARPASCCADPPLCGGGQAAASVSGLIEGCAFQNGVYNFNAFSTSLLDLIWEWQHPDGWLLTLVYHTSTGVWEVGLSYMSSVDSNSPRWSGFVVCRGEQLVGTVTISAIPSYECPNPSVVEEQTATFVFG